jgi:hypothetical protein
VLSGCGRVCLGSAVLDAVAKGSPDWYIAFLTTLLLTFDTCCNTVKTILCDSGNPETILGWRSKTDVIQRSDESRNGGETFFG